VIKTPKSKLNKKFFEIENMDTLAREDKVNDKNNQIHELLPRHSCRILMIGGSGQGKSNLALNMLYKPMLVFDKLYVYSSMLDQPKYKFLKRHYDLLDEMVK
jgi:acetaldehyde dehydrogenase (acetylating)